MSAEFIYGFVTATLIYQLLNQNPGGGEPVRMLLSSLRPGSLHW